VGGGAHDGRLRSTSKASGQLPPEVKVTRDQKTMNPRATSQQQLSDATPCAVEHRGVGTQRPAEREPHAYAREKKI
jgi:hypothetical protein